MTDEIQLFVCLDYLSEEREQHTGQATVLEQKLLNHRHIRQGTTQDEFIQIRQELDQELDLPNPMLPAVQLNIRRGQLSPQEENGISYLQIPLNDF